MFSRSGIPFTNQKKEKKEREELEGREGKENKSKGKRNKEGLTWTKKEEEKGHTETHREQIICS